MLAQFGTPVPIPSFRSCCAACAAYSVSSPLIVAAFAWLVAASDATNRSHALMSLAISFLNPSAVLFGLLRIAPVVVALDGKDVTGKA